MRCMTFVVGLLLLSSAVLAENIAVLSSKTGASGDRSLRPPPPLGNRAQTEQPD